MEEDAYYRSILLLEKGLNLSRNYRDEITKFETSSLKRFDSIFVIHLLEIEDNFKRVDLRYLNLVDQQRYRVGRGRICSDLFDCLRAQKKYEEAIPIALNCIEMLDGLTMVDYIGQGPRKTKINQNYITVTTRNALYNLGGLYMKMGQPKKALLYYRRGIKYNHIPSIYNTAAIYRFVFNDENKAEEYYIKAATTEFDGNGNPLASLLAKSMACSQGGNIYFERQNYEKALEMYKDALTGKSYWGVEANEVEAYIKSKIDQIVLIIEALKKHDIKEKDKEAQELRERIARLESLVLKQSEINEQLQKQVSGLENKVKVQGEIINDLRKRVDDLTDFVLRQQEEIESQLGEAVRESNEALIEKITSRFTTEVTNKLVVEVKEKTADSLRAEEQMLLEGKFTARLWGKLCDLSKDFLVTGKTLYRLLDGVDTFDYSAICLLMTKAVDNELHKYLYTNLIGFLTDRNVYPNFLMNKKGKVLSDNEFTLGSVMHFCCQRECYEYWDKKERRLSFNEKAYKFDSDIMNVYSRDKLFKTPDPIIIGENLKFISDSAEKIRKDYRNPSAHPNKIGKLEADKCNDYILEVQKVFIRIMDMFQ